MAKKKKINLTQSFKKLEEIVGEFEKGEVDLQESMPKYRKGLELARAIKKELTKIENEIVEIKEEFKDLEEDEANF